MSRKMNPALRRLRGGGGRGRAGRRRGRGRGMIRSHQASVSNLNSLHAAPPDPEKLEEERIKKSIAAMNGSLQKSAVFGRQLMGENQTLNLTVRRLKKELEHKSKASQTLNRLNEQLEEESLECRSLQARVRAEVDEAQDIRRELERVRAENVRISKHNQELRHDLAESRASVRDLQEEKKILHRRATELGRYESESTESREESRRLTAELARISDDLNIQQDYVDSLRNEKQKLTTKVKRRNAQMKRNFSAKMYAVQSSLQLSLEDMRVNLSQLRRGFQMHTVELEEQLTDEVDELLNLIGQEDEERDHEVEELKRKILQIHAKRQLPPKVIEVFAPAPSPSPTPSPVQTPDPIVEEVVVPVPDPSPQREPEPEPEPVSEPDPDPDPDPEPEPEEVIEEIIEVVEEVEVVEVVEVIEPAKVPKPEPVVVEEVVVVRTVRGEEEDVLLWLRHYLRPYFRPGRPLFIGKKFPSTKLVSDFNGFDVEDFFRDGLVFAAIVHRFSPTSLDWEVDVDMASKNANCRLAFPLIRKCFGVASPLNPEAVEPWPVETVVDYVVEVYTSLSKKVDAVKIMLRRDLKRASQAVRSALRKRVRSKDDVGALVKAHREAMATSIRLNVVRAQLARFFTRDSGLEAFLKRFAFTPKLRELAQKITAHQKSIQSGGDPDDRTRVVQSFNTLCCQYFRWCYSVRKQYLEEQNEEELLQEGDKRVLDDVEDDQEMTLRKRATLEENRAFLRRIWSHYNEINFGHVEAAESVFFTKEEVERENDLLVFSLHGLSSKKLRQVEEEPDIDC